MGAMTPVKPQPETEFDHPQKRRRGLERIWHAAGYSMSGLRLGWHEPAFRFEVLASIVLLPAAFWVGRSWVEVALLAGSVIFVMVVELLNTAIESTVDRVGPEWHEMSLRAKDMGSAAVFLSLALTVAIWGAALWHRFA